MTASALAVVDTYNENAARLLRSPDDPQALVDMFACLSNNGRGENNPHYLALAKRAYAVAPNEPNVLFNYASALGRCGRHAEAIGLYERCIALGDPDWQARSIYHLGIARRALGENEEAIRFYRAAAELEPDNPQPRQDIALAMLAMGRLGEGLRLYEVRHDLAAKRMKSGAVPSSRWRLPKDVRHWQGEDLQGKSVTVFHEEGCGDLIQFCRFIPRLHRLGVTDLRLAGPDQDVLDLVASNMPVHGTGPLERIETDYVIGSMSLPWRLGVEYADVGGEAYFHAAPARLYRRGKINVGLVWRGSPAYARDDERSMPFSALTPLFDVPGVAFHSLQKGEARNEISRLGFDGFVADLDHMLTDWRATAQIIAALDAVVTVDTAVAHLAGALGKPTFIMVPQACCWRWDRNSEAMPWYRSARVIRQPIHGNWAACVMRIRSLLEAML